MNEVFYYVYCQGLLGVKTNDKNFKWIYGSCAPATSSSEYEGCLIKFDITLKKEKHLNNNAECGKKFQAFEWNPVDKTLCYHRVLPLNFEVGYKLKIVENTVYVDLGERYNKFVKNRVMNLHGAYYLLSDLANIMLLQNGYLTLYASAIYSQRTKKCVLNFAPPSTGKTITAIKLCETAKCSMVGEDILITDGKMVYSCPWTKSYRGKKKRFLDSAGALFRSKIPIKLNFENECTLTDITVLSLGEKIIEENKELVLKHISILNGYLFHYYSSPVVKVLSYFDETYNKQWLEMSDELMSNMVNASECRLIQAKKSEEFADIIEEKIIGGK